MTRRFGRWTQRDPLGEVGGSNLYRFVSNDPLSSFDGDGLFESRFTDFLRDQMYEYASTQVGEGFARYLLGRYMYGNGEPLVLTPRAFMEHVGPEASIWEPNKATRSGTLPERLRQDVARSCGCSGDRDAMFSGRYTFGAFSAASPAGGLRYFIMEAHVNVRCEQVAPGDVVWDLEGDASMLRPDVYDFDWDLAMLWVAVQQNRASGRPDLSSREPRTAAGSFLPGKPFKTYLDGTLKVQQSSKGLYARFHE